MNQALAAPRWMAAAVVGLYGLFLFLTNPWVTVFEDEVTIVQQARRLSTQEAWGLVVSGSVPHEHPPLSDVLLHYWLRCTGESPWLLRAPFIAFYCLGLWVVAETAQRLWKARWTALALGVAWPAGYFLGRPAGWYGLTMLEASAVAWLYFDWRATGRASRLAALATVATFLVYTNYFGWILLMVWAADLAADRSGRRLLGRYLAALGVVALLFLPLAPRSLELALSRATEALRMLPRDLYLAHSLLVSEMAAPWTWPGALGALAGIGLLALGVTYPASRRPLAWLAGSFAAAMAVNALAGSRLVLFAPALLLFLASLVQAAGRRRPLMLLALAFGAGWLGVVTGRYAGAYRYVEPWPEVARRVVELSRPGDVILCNHPSFYFYLSYRLPWPASRGRPDKPVRAAGRLWAPLSAWPVSTGPRVLYLRTPDLTAEADFLHYAAGSLRLLEEQRWVRDRAFHWKQRFYPDRPQPEWRILLQVWATP